MKRFFFSFLGSMAAIWLSVIICGVLFLITIMAVGLSEYKSQSPSKILANSVLKIELSGEVVDREQNIALFDKLYNNLPDYLPLNKLLSTIKSASKDKNIKGILLNCQNVSSGLAQSQAIREALSEFKASGKWVYAYGDNYSQTDYFIASVSDSIFINPIGMIDIHGLSATNLYFKDLLDKLGVEVQVVKVGTFKSAVEPFILNQSSEANRQQQEHYLGNFWKIISNSISACRSVTPEEVNKWADEYIFADSTAEYINKHIADRMLYRHQLDELIVNITGLEADDKPRYVTVNEYAMSKGFQEGIKTKGKQIAILYALGNITESGSDGIVSDKLVPKILEMAKNEEIDGLILRINSGGGSAYASEQIWEALQQFKKLTKKPFYVSMSDVAASGGYYIACGADRIYAEPLTITGSIGIFGLIPDAHKLLNDKLGIHTSTVSTNKGLFPGIFNAMTPGQYSAMQSYVNRGYELFVQRVASGRGVPVDSIKKIAEGRVWDGLTASKIGLVDKLGSLETAISDMAEELGAGDDYYLRAYPSVKLKWWEKIFDMDFDIKESYLKKNLGEFAPFYEAAREISESNPLQCRMDFIIIE